MNRAQGRLGWVGISGLGFRKLRGGQPHLQEDALAGQLPVKHGHGPRRCEGRSGKFSYIYIYIYIRMFPLILTVVNRD